MCGGKGAEQSGISAAFGGVREEHAAQHCTANHLRYRHPGFRTALFYGGSSAARQDYSKLQEQNPDDSCSGQAEKSAVELHQTESHHGWGDFLGEKRQTAGLQQYLAAD